MCLRRYSFTRIQIQLIIQCLNKK